MKLHSWDDVPWSLAGPDALLGYCSNSGSPNHWAGLAFDIRRTGYRGYRESVGSIVDRYREADFGGFVVRGLLGHMNSIYDQQLIDTQRKNLARMGYDVLQLMEEDDPTLASQLIDGFRDWMDHLSPRLEKSGQALIGYVATWPWSWEIEYAFPLYRERIDAHLERLYQLWIEYPALSICFDLGTRWGPDHPFGRHMARVRDAKAAQGKYTWIEATHPRDHEHADFNNTFASLCLRRRLHPNEMRPGTVVAVANKDVDKVEVSEIPRFINECRANRMIPCVGIEHAGGAPVTPRRQLLAKANELAGLSVGGQAGEVEQEKANG